MTSTCCVCGNSGAPLFQCSQCRDAIYCSVACQTQDWTEGAHALACHPISSGVFLLLNGYKRPPSADGSEEERPSKQQRTDDADAEDATPNTLRRRQDRYRRQVVSGAYSFDALMKALADEPWDEADKQNVRGVVLRAMVATHVAPWAALWRQAAAAEWMLSWRLTSANLNALLRAYGLRFAAGLVATAPAADDGTFMFLDTAKRLARAQAHPNPAALQTLAAIDARVAARTEHAVDATHEQFQRALAAYTTAAKAPGPSWQPYDMFYPWLRAVAAYSILHVLEALPFDPSHGHAWLVNLTPPAALDTIAVRAEREGLSLTTDTMRDALGVERTFFWTDARDRTTRTLLTPEALVHEYMDLLPHLTLVVRAHVSDFGAAAADYDPEIICAVGTPTFGRLVLLPLDEDDPPSPVAVPIAWLSSAAVVEETPPLAHRTTAVKTLPLLGKVRNVRDSSFAWRELVAQALASS